MADELPSSRLDSAQIGSSSEQSAVPRLEMKDSLEGAGEAKMNRPAIGLRRCILVLGMHRSGTSATARLLNLLGAALPKNVMGAGPGNETGHWEPKALVEAHDRMLAEAGSRWDDWRRFDLGRISPSRQTAAREELASIIEAEYGQAPLMVLKDPRICRLVPFYGELLASLGAEPCCVMPLRNPLAVVASLNARDGMSEEFASLLWLRHVLEAEAGTRAWPRVVVSYEALLADWQSAVRSMAARLGFPWPQSLEEAGPEISAFLSTVYQHHAPSRHELAAREDVSDWVKASYEALLRLEQDPNHESALSRLDRIRAEFDAACPVFGAAAFAELTAREGRFLAERQKLAAEADDRATCLEGTLRNLMEQNAEAQRNIAALENSLAEAERRAEGLGRIVEEQSRQIAEGQRTIATLNKSIADRDHELGRYSRKIAAMKAPLSWRITSPFREMYHPIRRFGGSPFGVKLTAALRHPTSSRKRKIYRAKYMPALPPARQRSDNGRFSKFVVRAEALLRHRGPWRRAAAARRERPPAPPPNPLPSSSWTCRPPESVGNP